MAQTLDEFLKEAHDDINKFEKDWREKHVKSPDEYPLVLSDENEGLWWEFFRKDDDGWNK